MREDDERGSAFDNHTNLPDSSTSREGRQVKTGWAMQADSLQAFAGDVREGQDRAEVGQGGFEGKERPFCEDLGPPASHAYPSQGLNGEEEDLLDLLARLVAEGESTSQAI